MTASARAAGHLGTVARGGMLGLLGAAFSAIAGFALVVAVTRVLETDEAGMFFSATAAFLMVAAIGSLGSEAGLARFVLRLEADGRGRDVDRVLASARAAVLAAAVVIGVGLVAFAGPLADALGWDGVARSFPVVFAVALPVAVLSDFALSGTRAFGTMSPTVLVDRFLRAGGQAAVAATIVLLGGGLVGLTIGWLSAYAVAAVLATHALRRVRRSRPSTAPAPRTAPDSSVVRDFWRFTWPRGLTRFAQIGIQKADIVLVAALLGPGEAAMYTAATRFVALGQFATQALQQVLQPRFTAILVHEDRATLREVYQVATAWNVLLTWPVYLVIGCAPAAYLAVFGGAYVASDGALAVVVVMMLAMLLAVASGPVDTLLLMAGRSGRSLGNASAALVVDIGLCLLLLPRLGIVGAAFAWAAAVLTRCGLAYLQVRAELRIVPTGRAFALAVGVCLGVVGLPMTAASLLGLRDPVAWLLVVAWLALLDLAALWVLRRPLRLDVLVAALRPDAVRRAHRRRAPARPLVPRPAVATDSLLLEDPCASEPFPARPVPSFPTPP